MIVFNDNYIVYLFGHIFLSLVTSVRSDFLYSFQLYICSNLEFRYSSVGYITSCRITTYMMTLLRTHCMWLIMMFYISLKGCYNGMSKSKLNTVLFYTIYILYVYFITFKLIYHTHTISVNYYIYHLAEIF
jgi:hypothetical protein